MEKLSDLERNLDGVQETSKLIEKLLNEIIYNDHLTIEEIKEKASLCLDTVNRYTGITNRNVRLLNQQANYLLKKVQKMQEEEQENGSTPNEDSEFEIN